MKRYTSKDGFYIEMVSHRGIHLRHALLDDHEFVVWIPRFPLRKLMKRIDEAKQSLKTELSILSRHGLINPLQPGQYPDQQLPPEPPFQGGLGSGLESEVAQSLSGLLSNAGFQQGKF